MHGEVKLDELDEQNRIFMVFEIAGISELSSKIDELTIGVRRRI
jgi:hypothetical protein